MDADHSLLAGLLLHRLPAAHGAAPRQHKLRARRAAHPPDVRGCWVKNSAWIAGWASRLVGAASPGGKRARACCQVRTAQRTCWETARPAVPRDRQLPALGQCVCRSGCADLRDAERSVDRQGNAQRATQQESAVGERHAAYRSLLLKPILAGLQGLHFFFDPSPAAMAAPAGAIVTTPGRSFGCAPIPCDRGLASTAARCAKIGVMSKK